MKVAGRVLVYILGSILVLILSFFIFLLIGYLQYTLFVPNDYVLWVFKYPYSRFIIVIVFYLFLVFFYFFFKKNRGKVSATKKRKNIWTAFIILNIIGFYIIFTSVTVVTEEKIIDHSFLHPQGEEYDFKDIVKIEAGVRGNRYYFPFTHNRGDFYYKIQLMNGKIIDLNDEASGYDEENDHPTFVLNKLDARLVDMGITKESSMDNFHYTTESLDRMYTDQIKNILERK
ncbi:MULTISPECIES: hypothetical protein [Bacillaceae]|uniref:Uncharacterized protein n=1 Tax=Sutcliffiella horikoshii TaxID=79883 RepID=A0A5D4TGN7_9BACI|nr:MULTISPECIES: hypothetical protein [Bacillaceae]TYS74435.1 hypothetical protein FZC75_01665 [Sutcliffiella horikoshii]